MKTIAVIPTLNEEKNIEDVLRETGEYVDKIIVVDSSTDRTPEIVSSFRDVILINEKNKGKGVQLRSGIKRALELKPDHIVQIDGDGEIDPSKIPSLLNTLQTCGTDLVVGSRDRMRSGKRDLLNRFGLWWINQLTDYNLTDVFSGFIVFRREILEKLNLRSSGFEIETEIILESWKNSFLVSETNVRVPMISDSHCSRSDMLLINMFFDRWVLRNLGSVPRTKRPFMAIFCSLGFVASKTLLSLRNLSL